jgi:glycosyltransferase involved in cell wall biosynthesis
MEQSPLISIGIPTYNRPEGLKRTLEIVTSQSYRNIEIIVSDNASKNEKVRQVVSDFKNGDDRIIFFEQPQGIGIVNNFNFVREKASGDFFIWAADDDEWQGREFLSSMLSYATSNALVFPDAILSSADGGQQRPLSVYDHCKNKVDFVKVFTSGGIGYPFYGLYNLKLFYELGLEFKFDVDLAYYQEGIFLHKLFLKAPVKYLKEAQVKFSTESSKPSYSKLLPDFIKYFNRTVLIYATSDLTKEQKMEVFEIIFKNYTTYLGDLILNSSAEKEGGAVTKMMLIPRIKAALKIMMTGNK